MRLLIYNILILLILLLSSCSIETYSTRKIGADEEILAYVNKNELDARINQSGLAFVKLTEGEGDCPKTGDKVAFHYKGYFLDGEVFDSSYDKPYPLIVELGNGMIIKGLEESLMLMNKGSKAMAIIPFYLAYDDMENPLVPPYSNLIFELELIDFTQVKK